MALSEAEELELLELEEADYQASKGKPADLSSMSADSGPKTSMLESGVRGLGQGVSLGFWDELAGAGEAIGQAVGVKGLGSNDWSDIGLTKPLALDDKRDFGQAYTEGRDKWRGEDVVSKETNPGTHLTGEVGGGIAASFVPGLNLAKGASVAKMAGQAAVQGGLMGTGFSEADSAGDLLLDAGKGAALGGALGGAGGYAANKLSPLIETGIQKVSSSAGDLAKRFAGRAVGAERGTIKKLGGTKALDEIGEYALENKLLSPLASTDDILSRNEAVMQKAMDQRSGAYNAIDDAGASTFNPLAAAENVENKVVGNLNRGFDDTQELVGALDPHLSNILSRGDKNISMKDAQALVESLGKKAKFDTSRNNVGNDVAVDAYFALRQHLNEAAAQGAESVGVSGLKEVIEKANKAYSTGIKAKGLLDNKFAREQGNKLIGLTDTIAGAEVATAIGGPVAAATLAAKKGAERYGSQNAALGLNKVSKMLLKSPKMADLYSRNPQVFSMIAQKMESKLSEGLPKVADKQDNKPYDQSSLLQKTQGTKYQQVLENASKRGDKATGAAHFILQSTDPEYRKLFLGEEPQGEK